MESRPSLRAVRWALAAAAGLLGILGCADEGPVETPVAPPFVARSEDDVLAVLQTAYAHEDLQLLSALLAIEEGAAYEFHFPDPLPDGTSSWGAVEELRAHRRLWQPENALPGEAPTCSWLVHLDATFARESPRWTERTELYRSDANPAGLDPERWRATGATVQSDCSVETQAETDYGFESRSEVVVIEDRSKSPGTEGKYLLFRWYDLDGTWKNIKTMCL